MRHIRSNPAEYIIKFQFCIDRHTVDEMLKINILLPSKWQDGAKGRLLPSPTSIKSSIILTQYPNL